MSLPRNPLIVIPARLKATRLPDKPLADIAGAPMIVHVWRAAKRAAIGPVVVAVAEAEIARAVEAAGGQAVMTDPALASGSDRVHAAMRIVDPAGDHDAIINLQGDVPTIEPDALRAAFALLADPAVDIGTLAVEIDDAAVAADTGSVKAVAAIAEGARHGRALYFSRNPVPAGKGPLYHHFGIYAYRRAALERFVSLPHGVLEQRESLEQLRALEAGMRIEVALVDSVPLEVNTPADLERVRTFVKRHATGKT
ncbi:MAG TPA: 3-deoxy-manno-octulosonate cytidylyltransferase [Candidatus Cybelea sp.]|nr:3-deoxy-manno-octulosonate cytidylyltransferase [Candidatus Cybelea sp.]